MWEVWKGDDVSLSFMKSRRDGFKWLSGKIDIHGWFNAFKAILAETDWVSSENAFERAWDVREFG
jgi:hypothetical protein